MAEGASVAVAGRVMSRRFMGKLAFFKLVDASGSVQVGLPRLRHQLRRSMRRPPLWHALHGRALAVSAHARFECCTARMQRNCS